MDRIATAVAARDRDDLLDLWATITPTGDALHRCVLAHHLADLHDDAAESLMWDVRALDAADVLDEGYAAAAGVQVAAFHPSLHLNIADDLRRLSSVDAAERHLSRARAALTSFGALGPEHAPYVAMMRDLVDDVDAMVRSRSTERRATAPG
ncbi:hypothetical protein GCM10009722_28370 [Williamsia deligens]|nr:hypothetical protein [Williamsia deligens]